MIKGSETIKDQRTTTRNENLLNLAFELWHLTQAFNGYRCNVSVKTSFPEKASKFLSTWQVPVVIGRLLVKAKRRRGLGSLFRRTRKSNLSKICPGSNRLVILHTFFIVSSYCATVEHL